MRRVILALAVTAAAMVLLLSYKTAARKADPPAALAGTQNSQNTQSQSVPSPSAGAGGGTATTRSGTKTVTGDSVDTRWGPVQVQVTQSNGKITDVQAIVYPDGNPRDAEINSQALPILRQEALQAQSAQIDMVSGATVTSQGYLSSLQSALDKLHGA